MSQSTRCRSCSSGRLTTFLRLGDLPLPDALVTADEVDQDDARYPLDVAFCGECALVQLVGAVDPQVLFVDNYLYFSSYSDALLDHARAHATALVDERNLGPDNLVVEVASNDGYFLRNLVDAGVPVLGIDPAPDQAAVAEERGVPTLREFFNPELARRLRAEGRAADVIVANNVMAHTPDLDGFAEALSILLAKDGVATIENPWVHDLVTHVEFDTIYHEHYSYFSTTAVDALMQRHGLRVVRVEHLPIHGGSLRWTVSATATPEPSVAEYLDVERTAGVDRVEYYLHFSERVAALRDQLVTMLRELKAGGATIAAYGAAAKGSVMLNYCGIGTDLVDFVVDRNPWKQGRYMPGVHIPITTPDELVAKRPDYTLVLAWNFADEIVRQQSEYHNAGGRFIIPVPEPTIR